MALTSDQKSTIRFHLGYSQDRAISGALTWLNSVMGSLPDTWTETRIIALIARCDAAFTATQYTNTTGKVVSKTTTITGDAALVTSEEVLPSFSRRWRAYLHECQILADALGVDNYRG